MHTALLTPLWLGDYYNKRKGIAMTTRPNIFSYNDFRKFLSDFYAFRHGGDPTFSKAYICRELGLPNSRSYFQDVLNGKPVSELKVTLFIKLVKLDNDEARYFRVLVRFNQCNDPEEKELLLDQLVTLNRTPQRVLSAGAFSYYKEWYHSVVKAVLEVVDFKDDYADLAKRVLPPITTRQARASIKLLLDLGLIAKNELGFYKPTDKVISTGPFAGDDIVRQFQVKCFDAARFAIVNSDKQPKRILTKTISISGAGYRRLEKRLEKFSAEIRTIVHKDELRADKVYQLAIALFPQMRKP
jgi:uncharacterized protein (TIGR02147 family)